MKLLKLLTFLVVVVMFTSTLMGALAVDEDVSEEGVNTIASEDVKFSGDFTGEELNFFDKLFSGDSLSFTTTATDSKKCSPTSKKGGFGEVSPAGIGKIGKQKSSFPGCFKGDHVRIYTCPEKGSSNCDDLFKELWFKSSISDKLIWTNYDASDNGLIFTYDCYKCEEQAKVSTYTCWNDVIRGEPGTIYSSVPAIACTTGCKKSSTTTKTNVKDTLKKEFCADKKVEPEQGDDGADEPPVPDPVVFDLGGEWSSIVVPEQVKIGEDYQVKATFTAEVDGKYYLEAGTVEEPLTLAVVTAKGSKCDGSLFWAGEFVDLKAGESVAMEFSLAGREEGGTYALVIGSYSGCIDDGGKDVKKETMNLVFGAESKPPVPPPVPPPIPLPTNMFMFLGIGMIIVGIVLAIWVNPYLGVILISGGAIISLIAI